MRTRGMVAVTLALGLLAASCGDSKNDSLKGVAIQDPPSSTTPTTTLNNVIPAAYPGTTTFDPTAGFSVHNATPKGSDIHGGQYAPWGMLWVVGPTTGPLPQDLTVMNPSLDAQPASGVITSISWQQVQLDPITITARTSAATAAALTKMSAGQKAQFEIIVYAFNRGPTANASQGTFFASFSAVENAATGGAVLRSKPTAKAVTPITDYRGGRQGEMEVTLVFGPPATATHIFVDRHQGSPLKITWGGQLQKK